MKYGYFDDLNKEYVITTPKTPVKWINYIGGLSFGGFVDQTGGSLICKGDPATNRIVKYIPQTPASDFKGETCYIRIKKEQVYRVFSQFFTPTLDDYHLYECRVGMGYNKYISEFYGIRTEVLVFVPEGENRVIRDYRITNINNESIELDFIPVVEYTHFEAFKQFNNADWVPQTMMSEINEETKNKILLQYAFMKKDSGVNFFTSNYQISSFETDRKIFLGDNEYGTFKNPLSLQKDDLSNKLALRGDNIAALMHKLGSLKPNQSVRVITQLGQCENIQNELENIVFFRQEEVVDSEIKKLRKHWQKKLSKCIVDTPSKEMNSMLNVFNPRQCDTTLNWSRYLSLYQLGLGARGIGFRDTSQDIMGVVGHSPEQAKELIIKLLKVQKINGSAMHQFNPITMIANEGDSRDEEDRPDYYGDDHLWIVLSISSYLKETGNYSILDEIIPFYEKNKQNESIEEGTILEHMLRSLHFTKNNKGNNGLPLLGFADWNDTINLPKGAESVFISNLYGVALKEMIELLTYLGKEKIVNELKRDYDIMKEQVNKVAWDGEWYIRYFDDKGMPLGSNTNEHGKIFANAQSWSCMSGFADEKRMSTSLDAVYNKLHTSKGIKLSYPGYNGYDPEKGGVTTYPPGAKENGGIFLHSNPWVMIAETINGNGNRAFEYYNNINPATKNNIIDEFECEPYVYPQNILGDEHPQFGLGRNSWLSGTASWTYQAGIKYILGVRPTHEGLVIDPCIPSYWTKFSVSKYFRGSLYKIEVINNNAKQKGVESVFIDGKPFYGNVLPIFKDGRTHEVIVNM